MTSYVIMACVVRGLGEDTWPGSKLISTSPLNCLQQPKFSNTVQPPLAGLPHLPQPYHMASGSGLPHLPQPYHMASGSGHPLYNGLTDHAYHL